MGTWTANYQLYLAAAGEQGWGDAVNGNFETIDTKIKESMDAATAAAKTAEWGSISGKPSTYPPSTHTHPLNQITNRQQMIGLTPRTVSLPQTILSESATSSIPINGFVVSPVTISFSYKPDASSGETVISQLDAIGQGNTTLSTVQLRTDGTPSKNGSITLPAMTYVVKLSGKKTDGYAGKTHTVTFGSFQVYSCTVI